MRSGGGGRVRGGGGSAGDPRAADGRAHAEHGRGRRRDQPHAAVRQLRRLLRPAGVAAAPVLRQALLPRPRPHRRDHAFRRRIHGRVRKGALHFARVREAGGRRRRWRGRGRGRQQHLQLMRQLTHHPAERLAVLYLLRTQVHGELRPQSAGLAHRHRRSVRVLATIGLATGTKPARHGCDNAVGEMVTLFNKKNNNKLKNSSLLPNTLYWLFSQRLS